MGESVDVVWDFKPFKFLAFSFNNRKVKGIGAKFQGSASLIGSQHVNSGAQGSDPALAIGISLSVLTIQNPVAISVRVERISTPEVFLPIGQTVTV